MKMIRSISVKKRSDADAPKKQWAVTRAWGNLKSKLGALRLRGIRLSKKQALVAAACCLVCVMAAYPVMQFIEPQTKAVVVNNPIEQQKNIDELRQVLPFELKAPTLLPKGYKADGVATINKVVAQIRFSKKGATIMYRMAQGTEDISGDNHKYTTDVTQEVAGMQVRMRGDNDRISVATWNDGAFTYSLYFSKPVHKEMVVSIVENIK